MCCKSALSWLIRRSCSRWKVFQKIYISWKAKVFVLGSIESRLGYFESVFAYLCSFWYTLWSPLFVDCASPTNEESAMNSESFRVSNNISVKQRELPAATSDPKASLDKEPSPRLAKQVCVSPSDGVSKRSLKYPKIKRGEILKPPEPMSTTNPSEDRKKSVSTIRVFQKNGTQPIEIPFTQSISINKVISKIVGSRNPELFFLTKRNSSIVLEGDLCASMDVTCSFVLTW